MIEALDLLAENEVLEQSRAALSHTQTVLVFDGTAHIGGHVSVIIIEVKLGQEFLGGGGGIVAVVGGIAGIELAGHIRTGRIDQANDPGHDETESAHLVWALSREARDEEREGGMGRIERALEIPARMEGKKGFIYEKTQGQNRSAFRAFREGKVGWMQAKAGTYRPFIGRSICSIRGV